MSVACIKVNTTNVYLTKSIHLDQLAGIQASYLLHQPLQTLKQYNCKVVPLHHHCHVSPGANLHLRLRFPSRNTNFSFNWSSSLLITYPVFSIALLILYAGFGSQILPSWSWWHHCWFSNMFDHLPCCNRFSRLLGFRQHFLLLYRQVFLLKGAGLEHSAFLFHVASLKHMA